MKRIYKKYSLCNIYVSKKCEYFLEVATMLNKRSQYLLKTIGNNVRTIRNSKGLSQLELALRADCSRTQISRIENCEVNPTIILLNEIALALDTDIVALLKSSD